MAFVDNGFWQLTVMLQDNNGNIGWVQLRYPATLDIAAMEAAATGVVNALAVYSDAWVQGYNFTRLFMNDTYVSPPPSSEVERKAVFLLSDATGKFTSKVEIPSPVFAAETNGTDVLDLAKAPNSTMVTLLTNGGLGGGNAPITKGGTDITRVKSAHIMHRHRAPKK